MRHKKGDTGNWKKLGGFERPGAMRTIYEGYMKGWRARERERLRWERSTVGVYFTIHSSLCVYCLLIIASMLFGEKSALSLPPLSIHSPESPSYCAWDLVWEQINTSDISYSLIPTYVYLHYGI